MLPLFHFPVLIFTTCVKASCHMIHVAAIMNPIQEMEGHMTIHMNAI